MLLIVVCVMLPCCPVFGRLGSEIDTAERRSLLPLPWSTKSPCSGAYDNAASFQLTAWNLTGTNANATGAPLVVGFRESTGNVDGSYIATLVSADSYATSFDNTPTLSMHNGALLPSASGMFSTGMGVLEGGYLQFYISPDQSELPAEEPVYCIGQVDGIENSLLAVNGEVADFALCKSYTPNDWGFPYSVVFGATANSTQNDHIYDFASCYPVFLQVLLNN